MRLPPSDHTARPWRIHEVAYDFRVEDVWALPTPGEAHDFPLLVSLFASSDLSQSDSAVIRMLAAIRWKVGGALGWDSPDGGVGRRVHSLHERLPEDLRGGSIGPSFDVLPFSPLYQTDDEFAAEIANRTMHGVLHLGWVREGKSYRGQLAVLVKPNGLFGTAYMAAILPFRRFLVYPVGMRRIARVWRTRTDTTRKVSTRVEKGDAGEATDAD